MAWHLYTDLRGSVWVHSIQKDGEKDPSSIMYPILQELHVLFEWYGVPRRPRKVRLQLFEKIKTIFAVVQNSDEYSVYAPPGMAIKGLNGL